MGAQREGYGAARGRREGERAISYNKSRGLCVRGRGSWRAGGGGGCRVERREDEGRRKREIGEAEVEKRGEKLKRARIE